MALHPWWVSRIAWLTMLDESHDQISCKVSGDSRLQLTIVHKSLASEVRISPAVVRIVSAAPSSLVSGISETHNYGPS